ncbi:NAD-dependent epimerase/dehydratase family protein [Patescibacteria group bacterium]|nr:NAD-dependent epimerase/dehydratase family protein [Patescibacteria group bacterium]
MKKIIITGGSGFLGTQITKRLLEIGGYEIVVMDIAPPRITDERISFFKKNLLEPFDSSADYSELQHPHAIIHLSGKNINGRFTNQHKKLIHDTRVTGSRHLVDFISRPDYKPEHYVCASAVGFYGDQPGQVLIESSERNHYYFLSDVVEAWEEENLRAQAYGINVTCIRNGHIIGQGGILAEVSETFRFGIGSILGNGKDYMPWIDIRDLVELYILCATKDTPSIVNGVSNTFETQSDFSRAIGQVKGAKFYLPVSGWLLALRYGDFAREMLVDQQVYADTYTSIPFTPQYTDLTHTIRHHLLNQ